MSCLTSFVGEETEEAAPPGTRCEETGDGYRYPPRQCSRRAVTFLRMPWGGVAVCEEHRELHAEERRERLRDRLRRAGLDTTPTRVDEPDKPLSAALSPAPRESP